MAQLTFRRNITRSLVDFHVRKAIEDRSIRGLILNIGAGDQTYAAEIRGAGDRMIAADWPSSPTVNPVGVYCDAHDLPFRTGAFESVLCTEVLEHLADPRRALLEIHRVLKGGGTALLTAPFQYQAHQRPHDFFRFTYDCLELLAAEAGFEDARIYRRGESLAVALNSFKVFTRRIGSSVLLRLVGLAEKSYVRWYAARSLRIPLAHDAMALGYTVIATKREDRPPEPTH